MLQKIFVFILLLTTSYATSQVAGIEGRKNILSLGFSVTPIAFSEEFRIYDNEENDSYLRAKFNYNFSYERIVARRHIIGFTYSFNQGKLKVKHDRVLNDPKISTHTIMAFAKSFPAKRFAGSGIYFKWGVGITYSVVNDIVHTEKNTYVNHILYQNESAFDFNNQKITFINQFGLGYSWIVKNRLLINMEFMAGYLGTRDKYTNNTDQLNEKIDKSHRGYLFEKTILGLNFNIGYIF
jgi:hypothetical protein